MLTKAQKIAMILASSGIRFDANETALVTKQLEYVEAQTYDIEYSILKSRDFIPYSSELPAWADTWTYRQWDEKGVAVLISNYSDALPLVDVLVTEVPKKVSDIGAAYQWTIRDLQISAKLGTPLDVMRATAARNAIERKIDTIAATGIPERNIKGFLNEPSIPVGTLPSGGGWSTSTVDEILADLFYIEQKVIDQSLENHEADTLLLPPSQYGYIATKRIDNGNDLTILQFFLANSQSIKNVGKWGKLATAGSGGVTRAVAYVRSPQIVKFELPIEFEQLEPEKKNMSYVVDCLARVGGVNVYRPLACLYVDGL